MPLHARPAHAPTPRPMPQFAALHAAFSAPPESLHHDRGELQTPPDLDNDLGRWLIRMMGFYSAKTKMLHGAGAMDALLWCCGVHCCGAVGCIAVVLTGACELFEHRLACRIAAATVPPGCHQCCGAGGRPMADG
jgi:hypothetical protein